MYTDNNQRFVIVSEMIELTDVIIETDGKFIFCLEIVLVSGQNLAGYTYYLREYFVAKWNFKFELSFLDKIREKNFEEVAFKVLGIKSFLSKQVESPVKNDVFGNETQDFEVFKDDRVKILFRKSRIILRRISTNSYSLVDEVEEPIVSEDFRIVISCIKESLPIGDFYGYIQSIRVYLLLFERKFLYIELTSLHVASINLSYFNEIYSDYDLFERIKNVSTDKALILKTVKGNSLSDFINLYFEHEVNFNVLYNLELLQFKGNVNSFEILHYEYQNRFKHLIELYEKNKKFFIGKYKKEHSELPNESIKNFFSEVCIEYKSCLKAKNKERTINNFLDIPKCNQNFEIVLFVMSFYVIGLFNTGAFSKKKISFIEENLLIPSVLIEVAVILKKIRNSMGHFKEHTFLDEDETRIVFYYLMRHVHTYMFLSLLDINCEDSYLSFFGNSSYSIEEHKWKSKLAV